MANSATLLLTLFAGVNVSVTFWPTAVTATANALPMTHGLAAVRTLLSTGELDALAVARELAVGALWCAAAALLFARLVTRTRRDGTLADGG